MLTVGLVFIVQTLSFMNCSCNFICGLSDVIIKTFSQSVSIVTRHAVWSFIPFVTIRTRGHHIHQKMSYMRLVGLLRRLYERK